MSHASTGIPKNKSELTEFGCYNSAHYTSDEFGVQAGLVPALFFAQTEEGEGHAQGVGA
ncbi:hypothetical protein [Comamonas thiooxydans]|uniref:hypothetical protein n=1 Tax=Comamonas thiooxydans TaxID=363952 RepID=UPI0012E8C79F|nr:hypothetical protein [Comamonas thiooxydans]